MSQGAEDIVDRFVRAVANDPDAVERLTAAFEAVALEFSERYGISYDAWLDVGVPSAVLCRAGIRRVPSGAPRCRRAWMLGSTARPAL